MKDLLPIVGFIAGFALSRSGRLARRIRGYRALRRSGYRRPVAWRAAREATP